MDLNPTRTTLPVSDYDHFWRGAADYIRYNPGSRHRRRHILRLIQPLPFRTVLDVGCGNGALLSEICAQHPGVALTGADFSPEAIAQNRRRLPGMTFHLLDIERERLPEARFDLVTCCEVIEHVGDRRAAFANLAAMVQDGGHLLLTCPTGKVYPTDAHFGHVTHPSVDEIAAFAAEQGLQPVALHNWGWPTLRLFKELTNLRPEWAVRSFASGAYSVGRKVAANLLYGLTFLNLRSSPRGCQLFALLKR
jgi:ubiquinone/menaquinone biosynthesis C-methylase UbiE